MALFMIMSRRDPSAQNGSPQCTARWGDLVLFLRFFIVVRRDPFFIHLSETLRTCFQQAMSSCAPLIGEGTRTELACADPFVHAQIDASLWHTSHFPCTYYIDMAMCHFVHTVCNLVCRPCAPLKVRVREVVVHRLGGTRLACTLRFPSISTVCQSYMCVGCYLCS